jgi:hypothetical protein
MRPQGLNIRPDLLTLISILQGMNDCLPAAKLMEGVDQIVPATSPQLVSARYSSELGDEHVKMRSERFDIRPSMSFLG